MTSPKKADRPECRVSLCPLKDGRMFVDVGWVDSGRERVAARITKALKSEGHEAHATRIYCFSGEGYLHSLVPGNQSGGDHRHCAVRTSAPLEVVETIVADYFTVVKVDRTIPAESNDRGTVLDLFDGNAEVTQ